MKEWVVEVPYKGTHYAVVKAATKKAAIHEAGKTAPKHNGMTKLVYLWTVATAKEINEPEEMA